MNLSSCEICPHRCKVNRANGIKGRCKCDDKIKIALASIHNFEEPCISGTKGSILCLVPLDNICLCKSLD